MVDHSVFVVVVGSGGGHLFSCFALGYFVVLPTSISWLRFCIQASPNFHRYLQHPCIFKLSSVFKYEELIHNNLFLLQEIYVLIKKKKTMIAMLCDKSKLKKLDVAVNCRTKWSANYRNSKLQQQWEIKIPFKLSEHGN